MTPYRVLACDPGTKLSGFALVAPRPGNRVVLLQSRMVPSTREAVRAYLEEVGPLACVAVEVIDVARGWQPKRAGALINTHGVAQMVAALASDRCELVLEASSQVWRRLVVGPVPRAKAVPGVRKQAHPYDVMIAGAVRKFVDGGEGLNVHTRDAAALAVWATWQRGRGASASLAALPVVSGCRQ